MTRSLQIKDVAAVSGFSANTLRYYEQIGLLPPSERSTSGYRLYDQRTVDRLAFISRSKQLGCTLEEIMDLTTAWDGGQCGPIQDRLRLLVSDKITAALQQLADLITFTGGLHQAAAALERHRPDGPCDADCGCVSEHSAVGAARVRAVALTTKPLAHDESAIACTLAAGSMKGRVEDWQALLSHVERREPIEGGIRSVFATSVTVEDLIGLVAAEQDCCQFFRFAITVDTRGIALEVRAPSDAHDIVTSLFGASA